MGEAEAAEREDVERRGGFCEAFVPARWRPGLVEVVEVERVRRSRGYWEGWFGGVEYMG